MDCWQWTVGSGLLAVDCWQWTVGSGLLPVDCWQWTVGSGLVAVDCWQYTAEEWSIWADFVFGGQQNDKVLIVLGAWSFAESCELNFGEGCMKSIHCNVDLGYWLSICSKTERNHGKPWSSWPVANCLLACGPSVR